MVAINFQERFAADVEDGIKTQTIRKTARCKPGDALQLFTGQRTPACRKLREATCSRVRPITISHMGIWIDGKQLMAGWARRDDFEDGDCDFAKADGFDDFQDMADWFRDKYGSLPFDGFLIEWRI